LGLIDTEKIERVIGKTHVSAQIRASRGNGVSGKKINFKGQQYNIAGYFLRKHGIQGGLQGLQGWAKANGYSIKLEGDTIYIT
jgi:hypothetical protein